MLGGNGFMSTLLNECLYIIAVKGDELHKGEADVQIKFEKIKSSDKMIQIKQELERLDVLKNGIMHGRNILEGHFDFDKARQLIKRK